MGSGNNFSFSHFPTQSLWRQILEVAFRKVFFLPNTSLLTVWATWYQQTLSSRHPVSSSSPPYEWMQQFIKLSVRSYMTHYRLINTEMLRSRRGGKRWGRVVSLTLFHQLVLCRRPESQKPLKHGPRLLSWRRVMIEWQMMDLLPSRCDNVLSWQGF